MSISNAHFTVEKSNSSRFYFYDRSNRIGYDFYFEVTCDNNNRMARYRLTTVYKQGARDIIRKENASGVTLFMKNRQISNREAYSIFEPLWKRYLEGYPYENAEFTI